MAKYAHPDCLDAALSDIATSTRLVICSSQPASVAAATAAAIAVVAVDGADFTLSAEGTGRKLTVTEQAALSVTATGDATHISLDDGTDIKYVTTATLKSYTNGDEATVPAFNIVMPQPV